MNIREMINSDLRYSEINREERNYAAILYHLLMLDNNVLKFLELCGVQESKIGGSFGIYFEYSMLRDLWRRIKSEDLKRDILHEKLKITNIDEICDWPASKINDYFGVITEPSGKYIQYPGKWSLFKYDKNIINNDDFLKTCRFKWSFNIKPDIVIHLDSNHAICIEAKYESGEGSYPSQDRDKSVFERRKINNVGQMDLQKYMMEELLGIKTQFVFLVYKKEDSLTHKILTWKDAFSQLNTGNVFPFVKDMITNVS